MSHYELVYLMRVSTSDSDAQKLHTMVNDHIKAHGELIKDGEIGKRKLAYEIEKQIHANYWLIEFNAEPESIKELHRLLTLNEHVLRFLIAQTRAKTKEDIEREEQMKESMEKSRMRKTQEEKEKTRTEIEEKKKQEVPKKKEEEKEKLSLEELDQKLDELLKDDSLND